MKILWIPQISAKDSEGNILLEKDSNMNFLINLLDSDFGNKNSISLFIEFKIKYGDLTYLERIHKFEDIFCNPRHIYDNPFIERLHFDADYYSKLDLEYYDIIFVNEPTKATNIRLMCKKPKIVCYNHWLAEDNMKQLVLRQYEGMMNADLTLVNSNYVKGRILSNPYGIKDIRIEKLQPSYQKDKFKITKTVYSDNIIYNHRLSKDPYYLDAYNNLIYILKSLEVTIGYSNMPTVYFTNPSGKDFDLTEIGDYCEYINLESQEDYYEFLKSDKIDIHLNTFFESKGMWSMSTVESIATGNMAFMPNKFGYSEIAPQDYYGYCDTREDMIQKLYRIYKNNIYTFENNHFIIEHASNTIGSKLNAILEGLNDSI